MKTQLAQTTLLLLGIVAAASVASAQSTDSTYTNGGGDLEWSNALNWDPQIVPNNSGGQTFNVFDNASDPVFLDNMDATISSLTMQAEANGAVIVADHHLTSLSTTLGANADSFTGAAVVALALQVNARVDLGSVAEFLASDGTLNGGEYIADTHLGAPGLTAGVRFNGANIRTSNGNIQLLGPNTAITDENGNDALAHLEHIGSVGFLGIADGRSFATASPLLNEGFLTIVTGFDGTDLPATVIVNGDFTTIGYPLDPDHQGSVEMEADMATADAKMIITGKLTNYDPAHKTLNQSWFQWYAGKNQNVTTQVLGGSKPLDIVTSNAALVLFGANTGFRDKYGNDALRNLASSARLQIGDRSFSTVNNFSSSNRLTINGNTQFNVNGSLMITGGRLDLFPITQGGLYGIPADEAPYLQSRVTVRGTLTFAAGTRLRFGIYDSATVPIVTIGGAAVLNGTLIPMLFDGASVSKSDTFTVLTAPKVTGQFSNVANGGHVDAISFDDGSVLGSFLVTIGKKSVVLSDFQPAP